MMVFDYLEKVCSFLRIAKFKLVYGKKIAWKGHVQMRRNVVINIHSHRPVALEIGRNVFMNNYCSINCNDRIVIGDDVMFGESVRLYDHNHIFEKKDQPISEQGLKLGTIIIEDNCWLGANVVVLAGVRIGAGSVIGAGAVLSKSIPPNSVVIAHQDLRIRQR
ncbi:acyltransferase [Adlercreutzia muris]|uniref:acyltransferase n=1 Tax=Adlercreutzia muris TaxID=1796610 RepID=UPI0035184811